MFFVYTIENTRSKKIYIGHTDNLQERLDRHNGILKTKKISYTYKNKSDGIWKYVYIEGYNTRRKARKRERQLKSGQGRAFLQQFRSMFRARSSGG